MKHCFVYPWTWEGLYVFNTWNNLRKILFSFCFLSLKTWKFVLGFQQRKEISENSNKETRTTFEKKNFHIRCQGFRGSAYRPKVLMISLCVTRLSIYIYYIRKKNDREEALTRPNQVINIFIVPLNCLNNNQIISPEWFHYVKNTWFKLQLYAHICGLNKSTFFPIGEHGDGRIGFF